ncbi:MAG: ATP-dependent zinc protease [Gammaproteobacteria bacterium]
MYLSKMIGYAVCFWMAGSVIAAACVNDIPDTQQIYGWKEKVRVYPSEMLFRAKLDSGAKTSSINATSIKEIKRDGDDWVRFTINNLDGDEDTLELEVERFVKIKQHEGPSDRRPVVRMGICLGTLYKEVEVNLVDRSKFITGMLIGRAFMEKDVLIDPSTTYSYPAKCKVDDKK